MTMKETESLSIDQMCDALTEDEIEHIQLLSSHNLFDYVRDTIISRHSDDEVIELYRIRSKLYYTIDKGVDDDERD